MQPNHSRKPFYHRSFFPSWSSIVKTIITLGIGTLGTVAIMEAGFLRDRVFQVYTMPDTSRVQGKVITQMAGDLQQIKQDQAEIKSTLKVQEAQIDLLVRISNQYPTTTASYQP